MVSVLGVCQKICYLKIIISAVFCGDRDIRMGHSISRFFIVPYQEVNLGTASFSCKDV